MLVFCAGCNCPIVDRFLLKVLDQTWHSNCVQCHECRCTLTEKCFSRDGQLFCKDDFFRRFGTKCSGCSQGIAPSDLVRRARDQVYHVTCFNCVVCGKQLSTGDQLYFLDENQFICKNDYCNSKVLAEYRDELKMDDDDDDDDTGLHDDAGSRGSTTTAFLSSHGANCPSTLYTAASGGSTAVVSGVSSSGLHDDDRFKDEGRCPKRQDGGAVEATQIESEKSGTFGATSVHLLNTDSNCSVDSNCSDGSSYNNNNSYKERDKENSDTQAVKDIADASVVSGAKRRGPRTTIKAKQLETLKSAFASTPKPTRHIREQLAQETGLNMRVIQVWFQNRRSKERRMKQLSALGARRQFYRSPRRLRMIRPGEDFPDDSPALHGYYAENCDFYPGYSGYDFFAMSSASDPSQMAYVPLPSSGPGGGGGGGPPPPLTNPSNADQVSAHLHDGRLFMSDGGGGGGGGGRGPGACGKSTGGLLDPMHLIPAPVASPSAAVDVSTHPYDNGHGLLATTPDHALYMSQQQQQQQQLADNWR